MLTESPEPKEIQPVRDKQSWLSRASRVQGFLPAFGILAFALLLHVLFLKFVSATFAGIFFVYLAAMIAAAWCGYLPGLAVVLIVAFGVPYLFVPTFSVGNVNLGGVAVLLLVALMISRTAEEQRKAERTLRSLNDELDRRVREKTAELVTVNAALRKSNADLKRTNSDLEQFAYSASHDLQEPLRMVSIFTQLLQEQFAGKLEGNADEYMRQVIRSAGKLERLLKDLRSYLTVAGEMEAGPAQADAEKILKQVAGNLSVPIEENRVRLISTPLPQVQMLEVHLEQVLQNLIGNAVKYRSDNAPEIHVSAVQDSDGWLFSVRDNGIGIDPQYAEQIFGIFKRLHSSAYEGTGIGLALCQRIVERYGGRIWVESAPEQGATFFFTIPERRGPKRNGAISPAH
jgi:signal transduction histidine kinase